MTSPVAFRKTLLALAVMGASFSTLAQEAEIEGLIIQGDHGSEVIKGSYVGTFEPKEVKVPEGAHRPTPENEWQYGVIEGWDPQYADLRFDTIIDAEGDGVQGIGLWNSEIAGNLTLGGTTRIRGGDIRITDEFDTLVATWGPHGVVIEGREGPEPANKRIGGNLRHTGRIEVISEGTSGETGGLAVIETDIHGSLINDGTIRAEGPQAFGLRVQSAQIDGALYNNGSIEVEGDGAQGIEVAAEYLGDSGSFPGEPSYDVYNSIAQGLINKGSVEATGADVVGIHLHDVRVGGVINDGDILVEGDRSVGVDLDFVTNLSGLDNGGTIVAKGENAFGVLVDGARFFSGHNDGRQIRNSGTIAGEHTALVIGEFSLGRGYYNGFPSDPDSELVIDNQGTLTGGVMAIDAAFDDDGSQQGAPVMLRWGGKGTITGDLVGLSGIDITGQVRYDTVELTDRSVAHIRMAPNGRVNIKQDAGLELLGVHTQLQGDLKVERNAALNLNLYDEAERRTDPGQAILSVDGTAAFAEGSRVTFKADNAAFTADDTTYVLVEATELVDDGLSVASNSLLLKLVGEPEVDLEDNQIRVTVTGKGGSDVEKLLEGSGASGAGAAAAGEFTNLIFNSGAIADGDAVRMAFIAAMEEDADPRQRRRLVNQLAPELSGGTQRAAVTGQGLVNSVTMGRTSAVRGLSSGDQPQQMGVWIQRLSGDATQDASAGVNGFDISTSGIAFGVDGTRDNLTIGLAYSLQQTDVTGVDNKATVDSYGFALYGGWSNGAWFADGAFNYALSDNETTRTIATTTAKGDYSSSLLGGHLNIGYNLQLLQGLPVVNGGLTVQPQVAARYSRVDIDAYEESDTSSAARRYAKQTFEVGELGFGVRAAADFILPHGTLQPNARLMYFHDLIGDKVTSTSGFLKGSAPMVTYEGIEPEVGTLELSLGVDYRIANFTLGASYDRASKADYDANTLLAKVRYDF